MKKRKIELSVALITALFALFTLGYFVGRSASPSVVTTRLDGDVAASPVALPEPSTTPDAAPSAASTPESTPEPTATPSPEPAPTAATPTSTPPAPTPTPSATPVSAATPTPQASAAPASDPTPAGEPHYDEQRRLRINLATQAELELLPGIGETLAGRILAYRDAHGAFKKLTTLKNVSGIGDKRYDAIKDMITVD
ncbi:MAG: helix-hairpin-helix domain-containing protein [Oscillospiraceae bacterium]|jgi:competence protein ComEA|nr:helix-hairpin-helix domain-containing protein [Oscillospiraceae bacterium]